MEQPELTITVPDPENDYLFDPPPRCQRCFIGPPTFMCYGYGDGKYYCKECVLAVLEEMKLRGAELWKEYEAQLQPDEDEIIDLEDHRARRLQLFGA